MRPDRRCNIDDDIYEQDGAADAADWIVYDEFTECVSRVAAAWTDDWGDAEFAAVMENYLSRELLPKMLACTLFEMPAAQQLAFHQALGKHDGSVQHIHDAVHVHDDGAGHVHICDHAHADGDPRHDLVEVATHGEHAVVKVEHGGGHAHGGGHRVVSDW